MTCLPMQLETKIRIGAASYYRPLPHFLSILVRMRGNEGGSHKAPECIDGCMEAAAGFYQPASVCWNIHATKSSSAFSWVGACNRASKCIPCMRLQTLIYIYGNICTYIEAGRR